MNKKALVGIMAVGAFIANVPAQTVDVVTTNGLHEPSGVAIDASNNYYITDSANNRIVKYVPDTGLLLSLAGLAGEEGSNNGTGVFARFFDPKGIVLARGGLVVADSGNHVLRFVTLGGAVSTLAGTPGVAGNADGPAAAATFRFPVGLATDTAGNIYIADSKNSAIRKLDVSNNVTTLAGPADGLFEPAGVTVSTNGRVFIADTRNHNIKVIEPGGGIRIYAGSATGLSGSVNSLFASEALFSNPSGLLFLEERNAGLLVADTGNHTIRRVFFNTNVNEISVETYAGTPGQPGLVNGGPLVAKFNSPVSIVRDPNNSFIVVDLANNALRIIQGQPPLPPINTPRIGWVDFVEDTFTGAIISVLRDVPPDTFNNDVIVAILAEFGTETYYTLGPTPPSQFEDNIPAPSKTTGSSPPFYRDGMSPNEVFNTVPSILSPETERGDVTVKAISSADGRRPSAVKTARFRFKTANATIIGDNPASFLLTNITVGAEMWYTVDGTDPTNAPPAIRHIGGRLGFTIESNLTFKVRSFKSRFKPSEIITKEFSITNFTPNRISFGFDAGEASSDFVAAAGQTFYAPITLSVLPEQRIYSLQFAVTVTNQSGPPVQPGAYGYQTMLKEQTPGSPPRFRTIPAAMLATNIFLDTNFFFVEVFEDLIITNFANNLLGVGYLERFGSNHLYNTINQDLISFSQAHDTIFESKNGKVVVGGYSFTTPPSAQLGHTYTIDVIRPSATEDGVSADVYIETPLKGSTTNGPINARKTVTIGQRRYVVGDVSPFRWFNAGDFGDTNLMNNDVLQVFQSAVYVANLPPPGSDYFDAMDSSDGASTTFFSTNTITLTNGIVVTNLITATVIQTNLTALVTNVYFVTNEFLTNFMVISTNTPNAPQVIPVVFTNLVFTTNQLVINTSTNPAMPSYVVTNVVVTNLIPVQTTVSVTNVPGGPTLITNMIPVAFSIVTTNLLVTPITVPTQVPALVTNIYTGGPVPPNGFLELGTNFLTSTNTTIVANIQRFAMKTAPNATLDAIQRGDGFLNIDDIFVTFRRSLDPSLQWYARFWSNGVRVAVPVPNRFRGQPATPAEEITGSPGEAEPLVPPAVTFSVPFTQGRAGQTVSVPVRAHVAGAYPLRVLLLNLNVVPLNGAPEITEPVTFTHAPELGSPLLTTADAPGNFAAAWLDNSVAGLAGDSLVGTLQVPIPATASASAAYRVEIERVSSSPNGLALFPQQVNSGAIMLGNSTVSTVGDGIPDAWRLRYFGSLSSAGASAAADADEDGISNLMEFRAGTDPMNHHSALKLEINARSGNGRQFGIRFPTVPQKNYALEWATSPHSAVWTPIGGQITGDGLDKEVLESSTTEAKFYRVRLLE